jgi:hypothetical protein
MAAQARIGAKPHKPFRAGGTALVDGKDEALPRECETCKERASGTRNPAFTIRFQLRKDKRGNPR